ncbi:MAG: hypothetical protein QOE72_4653 [Chloroflexota bacterium]|jgi:hypothetical protein|nr:hypothetical protein [Chloroflexota bacterium]
MTPGFPDVDMGSWLPDRLKRRNAPAYARRMLGCPCAEGRADDAYLKEATAPLLWESHCGFSVFRTPE